MKLTEKKLELLQELQAKPKVVVCTIEGEQFAFNIDQRFTKEKIDNFIREIMAYIDIQLKEQIKDFNYMDCFNGLILKHFSDVPLFIRTDIESEESKINVLQNLVSITNALIDIRTDSKESLFVVILSAFDENEVINLMKIVSDTIAFTAKYITTTVQTAEVLKQLQGFIATHMKKVELSQSIVEKMHKLKNGEQRKFEKEVEEWEEGK